MVLVIGCVLRAAPAFADEGLRLSVEWDKLAAVIRDGTRTVLPRESWRTDSQERYGTSSGAESRWLGVSPRLSIVARDWNTSQRLWGTLGPTDQLRLSRSSRMVVARVRFADGRIAPFGQLGVGQWRVDSSVVATLPSDDVELAAQLGAGFEVRLAPGAALAFEVDETTLYREAGELPMLACPRLWSALVAARAVF